MNAKFESTTSTSVDWLLNDMNQGKHNVMWNTSKISDYRPHIVSVISYDYTKNQTNSLLKHFGTEYPNQYLLAPSDSGMYRYADPKFNNLGTLQEDPRAGHNFKKDSGGKYYICKYRTEGSSARVNPYQDDVHIFIYRAADLYFMLAEALNNLGRYAEASALINYGVSGTFSSGGVTWEGFSDAWTKDWDGGNRSYADTGIRGGKIGVGKRPFPGDTKGNDLAILNEIMLEQPCEGRTLPAMIRMAMRYDDYNIIADRVCPKYTNPGDIRAKILSGGYFIHWDLKITE